MNSFLLIESGATKLAWVLASKTEVFCRGEVAGLHPFLTPATEWKAQLLQLSTQTTSHPSPTALYYYGTGCAQKKGQAIVRNYFQRHLPALPVPVIETDLLAAARALCQTSPGVVGILGSGSNAASYDGQCVIHQRGGLGYVLGDEGSGAYLGRILLRAFLNFQLAPPIHQVLQQKLNREEIISTLYQTNNPSRYLAQFAPLLKQLLPESPFLEQRVIAAFGQFTDLHLLPLTKSLATQEVAFTGSIAIQFRPFLQKALRERDLDITRILPNPLPALLIYHQSL